MKRSILYLQYTSPANYPPLEHSGLILLKAGWTVNYFGICSEGASNKLTFPEPLAKCVSLWKHQRPGIKQKLHFAAFTLSAWWRALWQRPAWVYCSDPMTCPAAWLIGHFTQCKVLYHEHDSPDTGQKLKPEILKSGNNVSVSEFQDVSVSKNNFSFQLSKFQLFLLWCRKRVGQKADLVVLPNEKRLELFVQTTGRQKKSLCVYNCPRKDEVGKSKAEIENREAEIGHRKSQIGNGEAGGLHMAFHGSINSERLPFAVLEAMSRFPGQMHLSVVGYETVGIKGYMVEFLKTAERLGLGEAVEYIGALPTRNELLQQASHCDVGLAFMPIRSRDVNMSNMAGASNKPFDYLACGLALLVSGLPEWEEMYVRPGYGLACNPGDPEALVTQFRWFLEHPEETRQMGNRGRERILQEWNYETQFAGVQTIMES